MNLFQGRFEYCIILSCTLERLMFLNVYITIRRFLREFQPLMKINASNILVIWPERDKVQARRGVVCGRRGPPECHFDYSFLGVLLSSAS